MVCGCAVVDAASVPGFLLLVKGAGFHGGEVAHPEFVAGNVKEMGAVAGEFTEKRGKLLSGGEAQGAAARDVHEVVAVEAVAEVGRDEDAAGIRRPHVEIEILVVAAAVEGGDAPDGAGGGFVPEICGVEDDFIAGMRLVSAHGSSPFRSAPASSTVNHKVRYHNGNGTGVQGMREDTRTVD